MGENIFSNVADCVSATLLKTDSNADIFRKFFKPVKFVNGCLF